MLFHALQSFSCQIGAQDPLRLAAHHLTDRFVQNFDALFDFSPQITVSEHTQQRPLLIAVTILTSLAEEDLQAIGYSGSPQENVLRLAALAEASGMDGVVCSPLEARAIRAQAGQAFALVTPGVRPASAALDDQRRVMTPGQAISEGSTYLVVGRPITAAAEPLASLEAINAEIRQALLGD